MKEFVLTDVREELSEGAGKYEASDPDVLLEGVVEVLDVADEGLGISSVPVEGDVVDLKGVRRVIT